MISQGNLGSTISKCILHHQMPYFISLLVTNLPVTIIALYQGLVQSLISTIRKQRMLMTVKIESRPPRLVPSERSIGTFLKISSFLTRLPIDMCDNINNQHMEQILTSFQDLQSEDVSNLFVVGVLGTDPIRMFVADLHPQPICEVGVEETVGMEAVASLDHGLWVAALHDLSLKDLPSWEVVVDHVEVFVSTLGDYLAVDLGEVVGSLSCEFTDCVVAVQPAPAWTYFQAVQEVVHSLVGDVQRMDFIVQVFVENVAVSEPKDNEVAASWDDSVKMIEQLDDIGLEILRLPHAVKALLADIVSNQLQKHQKRVVFLLIPLQSHDIAPSIARVSTIDPDILEIVMVAEVPIPQIFVDGSRRVRGIDVACVARFMREVQLICQSRKEIVESTLAHHADIEVLFWDGEVSTSRITDHCHSISLVWSTELILVQSPSVIQPKDSIAILIHQFRPSLPARIYIGLYFIAI